MKKVILFASLLCSASISQAGPLKETPDLGIMFLQEHEAVEMQTAAGGQLVVELDDRDFEINFPGDSLNLCAWTDDSIFEKAKVGSDTMQDFNSCLLIYKSLSMDGDASYLWLSEGSGSSLNASHGARKLSDKRSVFRVTQFKDESSGSKDVPLSGFGEAVFMVMWVDKDRNQVIDAGELERVVLRFR